MAIETNELERFRRSIKEARTSASKIREMERKIGKLEKELRVKKTERLTSLVSPIIGIIDGLIRNDEDSNINDYALEGLALASFQVMGFYLWSGNLKGRTSGGFGFFCGYTAGRIIADYIKY